MKNMESKHPGENPGLNCVLVKNCHQFFAAVNSISEFFPVRAMPEEERRNNVPNKK